MQIKYGIQSGAVFFIQKPHDKKGHYHIVLNQNPQTDQEIILVSATKQLYKEKRYNEIWGYDEDTLIIIEDGQSKMITQKSAFNCNRYKHFPLDDLVTAVDFKRVDYTGMVIEQSILQQLRTATLRSPRLTKKYHPYL